MADTRPTKVSPWRAIWLCLLGIFAPKKLAEAEDADNKARQNFSGKADPTPRAFAVCRAFWTSLGLVLASIVIGYVAGRATAAVWGIPPNPIISVAQVFGAGLLLWGTLFVRGWEIQSYCGVTLTERVNQWIYRSLYCVGTGVIIWSLALPA